MPPLKKLSDMLLRFFQVIFAACLPFLVAAQNSPNILVLIADDWSYPHAGIYGDPVVQTPNFDRLAREGVVFDHAYCASPSCTPSRAALLTGKYPHELGPGGNLWSLLPDTFPNYVALLEKAGYITGKANKGWGPGNEKAGGYPHNPAGPNYDSFTDFLKLRDPDRPFCFWDGSNDPHRMYEPGSGANQGMDASAIDLPPFFPDLPEVRDDILDYFYEVERFDRRIGTAVRELEKRGLLDNTIIVITSDNGMPFPRSKANLYDYGTRVPLAIYWKGQLQPAREMENFVNLIDLAPTFLEATGLSVPGEMSGKSLLPLLKGQSQKHRDQVFLERERHAYVRPDNQSYPMRAVRTKDYLYIRNLEPERYPTGDPVHIYAVGAYGDCDDSVTKDAILEGQDSTLKQQAFGKRPAEELYVLAEDPYQMANQAANPEYSQVKAELHNTLNEWQSATHDPRANDQGTVFEKGPYFGGPTPSKQANRHPRSGPRTDIGHPVPARSTALVDPFLGSINGNVLPGASVPFGMVKLSPDIMPPQPTSGYRPGKPIAGFSHTHTSGTGGGGRYGNILFTPLTQELNLKDYASLKQVNERAAPGYYAVTLARKPGDVEVELTASAKVGYHRYTFFTWDKSPEIEGQVIIDVAHAIGRTGLEDSRCLEAEVEIVGENAIQGWGHFAGGWGGQNPYKVYFFAQFDRPFYAAGVWQDTTLLPGQQNLSIRFPDDQPVKSRRMGAWATFKGPQRQQVEAKVGLSFKSIKNAKKFLNEEKQTSFDQARAAADQCWDKRLSRIEVEGGLPEHQRMFYSTLRNTFLMPTEVTGATEDWSESQPHYWDHYCIWDVFRTVMPLHTLISPEQQRAILQSLLAIYEKDGWLPDAWIAGDFGSIQGGTNVDVVFADAVAKELGGFNMEQALKALRHHAEHPSDNPKKYGRHLEDYLKLGYVTSASAKGATSRSLEYAYNDYCIAEVAEAAGDTTTAQRYRERSQGIFQLFNKEAGHFWAKDQAGNWQPGITTENLRKDHWNDPYFYEATPLAYSSYVPHDMRGLIQRHGSPEAYIKYLDRLLLDPGFDLGNEPLFLLPYQYIYAGRPDKTAEAVQHLMRRKYAAGYNGLPGQDDSGAISSWYVFSSIGFFPVAGQDVYLIGSPLFDRSRIRLENGKTFSVVARRRSAENIYVQSAKLNGIPIDRAWFRHRELMQGGTLELIMGSAPSEWGKVQVPPSLTQPAPYAPEDIQAICWNMVDYHLREIYPKLNYVPVMEGAWTKNAYWNAATFYTGLWKLYEKTGHAPFFKHMADWGKRERFTPLKYDPDIANNHLAAHTWLEMYQETGNKAYLEPSLTELDRFMRLPYEGRTEWWWCDALFMAPPTFALATEITGDPKYLDFMHEKWVQATKALQDPATGLFFRDAKYVYAPDKPETHGKDGGKVFWSRGNGWVMGGIVRVLEHLPESDPRRSYYIELLQQMAASIAPLQGKDGLWRVSLSDTQNYPLPETSGTALFCYALANGIRNGYLDEATYRPVMERAWEGLLQHIRPDGSLGSVQRVGHAPEQIDPDHTEPFGLGAFLLAAVEVMGML